MLNNEQVRLLQVAVKSAGIRQPHDEGRYRLLLAQYRDRQRRPLTTCKDLTREQLEDILAICEAAGWRHPGRPEDFYRSRQEATYEYASYAQQRAITELFEDLGYTAEGRLKFIGRMTRGEKQVAAMLTPREAYNIIEALKAMLSRARGRTYHDITDVQEDMEVSHEHEPAPF